MICITSAATEDDIGEHDFPSPLSGITHTQRFD
jgi:hypothetical protein